MKTLTRTVRPRKTDMAPYPDGVKDNRAASSILCSAEARSKRLEAMLQRTAAESPEYEGDLLWTVK